MPSRACRAALAVLLAGALVACGGTTETPRKQSAPDEKEPGLVAGTCWGSEQLPAALGEDGFADWIKEYARGDEALGEALRDDAAFSEQVDCAERHSLELYNVVELDEALTAQIKEYADLLDHASPLYRKVRDQVNDRCVSSSPYGEAQRAAGNLPVQLGPSLNAQGGLHVAWDPFPADLWAEGERKFLCTFQQDRAGTVRFADLTTSKVPPSARVCLNTPGTYVPCSGKHQAEDIAEMILNTAIEKGLVNGRKAVNKGPKGPYVALSDAEYTKLDRVCQAFLDRVSTKKDVAARVYPGSVEQWPTKTGAYIASCFALKPYEPPPPVTGTVFDKP